jgi:hypothetical protein
MKKQEKKKRNANPQNNFPDIHLGAFFAPQKTGLCGAPRSLRPRLRRG